MNHENLDSTTRPERGEFELPSEFGLPSRLEPEVVAEAAPDPSAPPKVVIEYRTKGLPWPLVVPLLLLVSFAVAATYHRLSRWSSTHPAVGSAVNPRREAVAQVNPKPEIEPAAKPAASEPLSLSSQRVVESGDLPKPIEPGEFIGPPVAASTDLNSAFINMPFPDPLLSKIPDPQVAELPPPAFQTALIFTTPVPAFSLPKQSTDAAPESSKPSPDLAPAAADAASEGSPADRVATPVPEPLPTREKVLADIQREADEKQAERLEMRQLKDQLPDLARQEAAAEVQEQRTKFVAELRALIREKKGKAGVDIGQLHLQYNENVDARLEYELRRLLKRFSGRASIRAKIKALRALGLPEPRILEIVVMEVHRREHSGRCDRFEPEMYVLAARELIATELPTPAKARANPGPTRTQ